MNLGDKALFWLSDRGSSSSAQFHCMVARAASGKHPDTRLKGLEWRLRKSLVWDGHAESLADGGLLATPPVVYRTEGGEVLLMGARTLGFIRAAEQAGLNVERFPQALSASRWKLSGNAETLGKFASSVSAPVVECPGLSILRALPRISALLDHARQTGRPVEEVERWELHEDGPKWSSQAGGEGYYRQGIGHRTSYYWHSAKGEWRSLRTDDERAAARWSVCTPHVKHTLVNGSECLSVSPRSPLPDLLERALRSASGREPLQELNRRVYPGVPKSWAVEVARILKTPLRAVDHG